VVASTVASQILLADELSAVAMPKLSIELDEEAVSTLMMTEFTQSVSVVGLAMEATTPPPAVEPAAAMFMFALPKSGGMLRLSPDANRMFLAFVVPSIQKEPVLQPAVWLYVAIRYLLGPLRSLDHSVFDRAGQSLDHPAFLSTHYRVV
jgi:hypothetical protein